MSTQGNTENNTTDRERRLAQLKPIIVDILKKAFPQNKAVTDNIDAIFDLFSEKVPAPDDNTRKLGFDFLKEAIRDTKSCKLLHSKKLYPHAVYHLQQAVEKCIKGYVLIEGYFTTAELKEIMTHQSPLVMIKAVLERTGIKKLVENYNDKTLKEIIKKAEDIIANEEKRIKIAKTSREEIRGFFSLMEEYGKKTSLIKQGITDGLTSIGLSPMSTSFFQNISAIMNIMILGIITFPHEAYTRYPDGKMTPNDYNEQLGIVYEIPKMVRLLEGEIRNLEKFYEQHN